MEKIQPISKRKVIDYVDMPLENFWQLGGNAHWSSNKNRNFTNLLKSTLNSIRENSIEEGIVCIQTEALKDQNLIKQIFDIAQNFSVRFYILVNDYSNELNLLNGICLIRYDLKNKGSFILINPNSNQPKGLFFTGQLTEQSMAVSQHIYVDLSPQEQKIQELFRHFCYQFWEVAKKEVIEKQKHTEVSTKPLDIWHDINKYGEKDFVYGTLFPFIELKKRGDISGQPILYLNRETLLPTEIKEHSETDLGKNLSQKFVTQN